jgi:hypothetical protein
MEGATTRHSPRQVVSVNDDVVMSDSHSSAAGRAMSGLRALQRSGPRRWDLTGGQKPGRTVDECRHGGRPGCGGAPCGERSIGWWSSAGICGGSDGR